jgi:hypothetical protein
MSFEDCLNNAVNDPEVQASKERAERAQKMWRDRADQYEKQGHPRHTAEQMAAEDTKAAFKREYGDKRHIYLSVASAQRKAQAHVAATKTPDMMDRLRQTESKRRGLVRWVNGRLGEYLNEFAPSVKDLATNTPRNVALMRDIVDELHGKASGSEQAKALAGSVRKTMEDLRLMFNEQGGLIGKMEDWGLPHMHDKLAVMRAGKDRWMQMIDPMLDWGRMVDPEFGAPLPLGPDGIPPLEMRQRYLADAWDNIVFGSDSKEATYGRPKGVATYRKHSQSRSLHFKDGQTWMDYNRQFGTGDAHASVMGHVHRMARDITLMREFGPNPKLGAEYESQLWRKKSREAGDTGTHMKVLADSELAMRGMNVLSGGTAAQSSRELWTAKIMATGRSLISAARLDRAIVSSLSDLNTMQMAAKSMGMNRVNIVTRHIGGILGVMKTLSKDDMLRMGWIHDTMADGGMAVARFQEEFAPAEWANRVAQISMRVQGLSYWTDHARMTTYFEWAGHLASQADREIGALSKPVRDTFARWKITAEDWNAFRSADHFFTAENGATFLSPLYFRKATALDPAKADDLFFKFQGASEDFLEQSVVTGDVLAKALFDPAAFNLAPGSVPYEIMKSGLMFKSFPLSFSINQMRAIMRETTMRSRAGYVAQLAAGATLMGAMSLQVGDLLLGRDPQDMTDPMFWVRATTKGGGFGIIGDLVSTGQTSWGGGFGSYVSGPAFQLLNDAYGITIGPAMTAAYQAATGQEIKTGIVKKLAKFGKSYTPMGQTPVIGPAIDRLVWDQLQLLLDPSSADALAKASKARKNLTGGGEWWPQGKALPARLPNLGTTIGASQ